MRDRYVISEIRERGFEPPDIIKQLSEKIGGSIQAVLTPFQEIYSEFRDDIFKFAALIGFEPTWQQAEIMKCVQWEETIAKPEQKLRRIAVKSGQGPGKTALTTVLALFRQFRHPGAWCVVMAPSEKQAKNWLKECERSLEHAPEFLRAMVRAQKKVISFLGDGKYAIEVATAAKKENAAGVHHPYLTVIIDEATGVDREIIETCLGTMTQPGNLIFLISNPTDRDTAFFDCFNEQQHLWHTFTFNSEESPIVDKNHIKALEDQYGRDSDLYRFRVLGKFPKVDRDTVINIDDLHACTKTDPYRCAMMLDRSKQVGIDLARFGSDESVVYARSGGTVVDTKIYTKTEPITVILEAFERQKSLGWSDDVVKYVQDMGGLGGGLAYNYHDRGKQILEFYFHAHAHNSKDYQNKITEAYFHFSNLLKQRKVHLKYDRLLFHQLSSRKYEAPKGRLKLETKEKFADRNNKMSPDRADAMVLTFYYMTGSGGIITTKRSDKRVGVQLR